MEFSKKSRRKTALQAAEERRAASGKRSLEVHQLFIGLAVLALLLALAAIYQAWQSFRVEAQRHYVQRTTEAAATDIAERLQRLGDQLLLGATHEHVRRAARQRDDRSRMLAEAAMRERVPELRRIEFFAPDAQAILDNDLLEFGFAKAQLLVSSLQRGEDSHFEVHGRAGQDRHLAKVLLIRSAAGVPLGAAYVELPMRIVLEPMQQLSSRGAYLDLRQGGVRGADLVIFSVDGKVAPVHEDLVGFPVAGSLLRVQGGVYDRFRPLPLDNPWSALMVAALLALMAVLLVMLRLGWSKLQAQRAGAEQPTMAAVLAQASLATQSAEAGALAASAAAASNAKETAVAAERGAPPQPSRPVAQASPQQSIDRHIFRGYDIRGVVPGQIDAAVARLVGLAVGSHAREQRLTDFVVGRDVRASSAELASALIDGLTASGCNVIDIGQVTSPMMYFACFHLGTGCGVIVTGSHNAPDYNGFKIVIGGQALVDEQIQELYARIIEGRLSSGKGGLQALDIRRDYIDRIAGDVQLEQPLKVVVDCGNSVAGLVAPEVLAAIGCDVEPLYCDPDPDFPNHHPDPAVAENLRDLQLVVQRTGADLGIAFDGDGDRLGVVTAQGKVALPDQLLMLLAIDLLARNPGASIVYDVKFSSQLSSVVLSHGGSPQIWRCGHSQIKARMRETGAQLGGEMTGHYFFAERWYGFDDGIYAACRLLEIIAADGRALHEIIEDLPLGLLTPELFVPMPEGEAHAFVERFIARVTIPDARVSTIDGLRAEFSDGWALLRASNTSPKLMLRFEGESEAALDRIQTLFRKLLTEFEPAIELPF